MHHAMRLALAVVFGLCAGSTGRSACGGLRAGCAKVDITPPLGLKLIGSQGKPSDSVLDELYARALVLCDGASTVAIVSVDLLYAPLEEITNPVRALVAERVGIPGQNVMVCATHTHSGPDIFTNAKLPPASRIAPEDIDQAYVHTVIGKLASVVQMAHRDMQDAKIGVATGALPEVAYNRRPKRPNGQVQTTFTLPAEIAATRRVEARADGRTIVTFTMPPEQADLTFGPIDPAVSALRVEDPNGQIIGSLFAFAVIPSASIHSAARRAPPTIPRTPCAWSNGPKPASVSSPWAWRATSFRSAGMSAPASNSAKPWALKCCEGSSSSRRPTTSRSTRAAAR
jgi:hypothetical protein